MWHEKKAISKGLDSTIPRGKKNNQVDQIEYLSFIL